MPIELQRLNPAIQGLRALAIALVILCHFSVNGFQAGFIGVDVFFVISGFLITRLLLQEYAVNGDIKIIRFYAHRIKRLFPALMFMLLITTLAVIMLLSPLEQQQQIAGIASSVVWLSNLQFSFSNMNYFLADSSASVVLHTWSLAVEEQFYLIWPIILLFFFGHFNQGNERRSNQGLFRILLVTAVVGFVFSMLLAIAKPIWAYYLMPSRIWQFAFGALICTLSSDTLAKFNQARVRSYLGTVGGFGIIMSLIIIDRQTTYPGFIALLPTLSTVVLLLACQQQDNATAKIFSVKPLVLTGNLSYSLYLWHWPVLAIAKVFIPDATLGQQLMLLIAIVSISAISYFAVEQPIRNLSYFVRFPKRIFAPAIFLIVVSLYAINFWNKQAEILGQDKRFASFTAVTNDVSEVYFNNCDEWFYTSRAKACVFGNQNATKTIVVMGDSVLLHWYPAIKGMYSDKQWRIIVLTKSSCPVVEMDYFYARIGRVYYECHRWRGQSFDLIRQLKPDVVLMGSSFTYPFTDNEWQSGMKSTLIKITPYTKQAFLLLSSPVLSKNIPECLAREKWHTLSYVNFKQECDLSSLSPERERVNGLLLKVTEEFVNVKVIDTAEIACPGKTCHGIQNGIITYRDSMHLTAKYSASLEHKMREAINSSTNSSSK